jgi:hypothetical protein
MPFASTMPKVVRAMFSTSRVVLDRVLERDPVPTTSPLSAAFCFSLLSLAEPGVMARILEQFAKRGLMPTRWFSDIDAETRLLQTDIQLAGLPSALGEDIGRGLRAIVGVDQVLTGTKSGQAGR